MIYWGFGRLRSRKAQTELLYLITRQRGLTFRANQLNMRMLLKKINTGITRVIILIKFKNNSDVFFLWFSNSSHAAISLLNSPDKSFWHKLPSFFVSLFLSDKNDIMLHFKLILLNCMLYNLYPDVFLHWIKFYSVCPIINAVFMESTWLLLFFLL